MKVTNSELLDINAGLVCLLDQPVKGGIKFDIMKNYLNVKEALGPVYESLEKEDNGLILDTGPNKEILEREQEIEISKLPRDLIESMEITTRAVIALRPIIKEESNAE